ncbi:DUF2845 domain-containing protein [Elizabethkingia sp. HX XZB]|uniref:DUF2845 domain-containing protein n=1 Tax=Elizabethkingia sp. HX XZB TaxID=3003193 RepID=UPI002A240155|nr:DUF2845 domain-containing protein [Elizabethkingia sp. HX XZB]MDX8568086.1 DUF2845 domain-containing protein [Elizabethkingia sp. HX XZB]
MRKKITKSILLILLCIFISSCATTSKFSSESVNVGMTKEEVIAKFGKPYKSSFEQDKETGAIEETLFYREFLYISGNSNITNILTFKAGKLISLKQGQESGTSTQTTIINTPHSTIVQTPN